MMQAGNHNLSIRQRKFVLLNVFERPTAKSRMIPANTIERATITRLVRRHQLARLRTRVRKVNVRETVRCHATGTVGRTTVTQGPATPG